jgi:hypothetical protein
MQFFSARGATVPASSHGSSYPRPAGRLAHCFLIMQFFSARGAIVPASSHDSSYPRPAGRSAHCF